MKGGETRMKIIVPPVKTSDIVKPQGGCAYKGACRMLGNFFT